MELPLLITVGDPNGIGPELIVRVFGSQEVDLPIIILGPESVLELYCDLFRVKRFWKKAEKLTGLKKGVYVFFDKAFEGFFPDPSKPSVRGGKVAIRSLELACGLIKRGVADAVVTSPVSKSLIQEAGYEDFLGHTEFFARAFKVKEQDICMHLCCSKLKVSLVTTHIPISQVPDALSIYRILKTIELTWEFVTAILHNPAPICVCGLNPHAGEDGKIGTEEYDFIIPAINEAKKRNIKVVGPYSADTIFFRAIQGEFSAVVAMYHDQGLAPLKSVCFYECVNVTLGLPFIRTSVGHGTAYELAGKGIASLKSFKEAIKMAGFLKDKVKRRNR